MDTVKAPRTSAYDAGKGKEAFCLLLCVCFRFVSDSFPACSCLTKFVRPLFYIHEFNAREQVLKKKTPPPFYTATVLALPSHPHTHMLRATPRRFARGLAFGRRPHVRPPPPPPPPSFVTQSGVPELSLFSVVGANMVVHAFWQDRRWQPFMHRHFVLSLESVRRRRWHTMITSAFSQLSPSHLLTNMVMLSFFGLSLPRRLGVPAFATLYLAGSVVSSSAWLAEQQTLRDRTSALRERAEIQAAGCVGASGAVAACVTGACVLDPGRRVYLFFLVPIPAIGFAGWRLDRASDPDT